MRCLDCVNDTEQRLVVRSLSHQPGAAIDEWFRNHFSVANREMMKLLDGTSLEDFRTQFLGLAFGPWGFEFKWEGGLLRYEERHHWFFDGYLAYLTYKSPDGHERWSRKVPYLRVPIYPFVHDGRVLYVGMEPPGTPIVVEIHLNSGAVVRKVAIPYPSEISIQMDAPVETYPYEVDGALVLQGTSLFVEGGKVLPGARTARIPSDILILPRD